MAFVLRFDPPYNRTTLFSPTKERCLSTAGSAKKIAQRSPVDWALLVYGVYWEEFTIRTNICKLCFAAVAAQISGVERKVNLLYYEGRDKQGEPSTLAHTALCEGCQVH